MMRALLALMVLIPATAAADAGCFCDPRTQQWERPSALECLTFVPIDGCLRVTVQNGCSAAVVLKGWPNVGADMTVPAGEGRTVVVHAIHQVVPERTELIISLSGKSYTVVHAIEQNCSGACSAGSRPVGPAWLGLLLLLLAARFRPAR